MSKELFISFNIDRELGSQLREVAAKEDRTMKAVMRRAVQQYLNSRRNDESYDEQHAAIS